MQLLDLHRLQENLPPIYIGCRHHLSNRLSQGEAITADERSVEFAVDEDVVEELLAVYELVCGGLQERLGEREIDFFISFCGYDADGRLNLEEPGEGDAELEGHGSGKAPV